MISADPLDGAAQAVSVAQLSLSEGWSNWQTKKSQLLLAR